MGDHQDVAVGVGDAHLLARAGSAVLDRSGVDADGDQVRPKRGEVVGVEVEQDALMLRVRGAESASNMISAAPLLSAAQDR